MQPAALGSSSIPKKKLPPTSDQQPPIDQQQVAQDDLALRQLCARSDKTSILHHIEEHPNLNFRARSSNGNTALHWAASNPKLDKVTLLAIAKKDSSVLTLVNNAGQSPIAMSSSDIQTALISLRLGDKGSYELESEFTPPRLVAEINKYQYSAGVYSSHTARGPHLWLREISTLSKAQLDALLEYTRADINFNVAHFSNRDAGLRGLRQILQTYLLKLGNDPVSVYLPGCGTCAESSMLRHYYGDSVKIYAIDPLLGAPEGSKPHLRKLIHARLNPANNDSFYEVKAQEKEVPDDLDIVLIRHPHPDHLQDWKDILSQCKTKPWKQMIMTFTREGELQEFKRVVTQVLAKDVCINTGTTDSGLKILTHKDKESCGPDHCYMVITPKNR